MPKIPRNDSDIFAIDSVGSQNVRDRLEKVYGSANSSQKILKADAVLSNASIVPAFQARQRSQKETANQRERRLVGYSKKHTAQAKSLALHRTRIGNDVDAGDKSGLELSKAVAESGSYDLWSADSRPTKKVKIPKTLRSHQLLDDASLPAAISIPHPGTSYNPSLEAHQGLLREALKEAEVDEADVERIRCQREKAEASRNANVKEIWQAAEEEVGSGSEVGDATIDEPVIRPKTKPKTVAEKKRRLERLRREKSLAKQREISKTQKQAIATLPSYIKSLSSSERRALEKRALKTQLLKGRLSSSGLSKLRSGKYRVPKQFVDYQLEEDLAEGLRSLKSEGSLWKDIKHSLMKRGKLEPRSDIRREHKQKGRRQKEVERYGHKRFE